MFGKDLQYIPITLFLFACLIFFSVERLSLQTLPATIAEG
jgi:hypothetical protein